MGLPGEMASGDPDGENPPGPESEGMTAFVGSLEDTWAGIFDGVSAELPDPVLGLS